MVQVHRKALKGTTTSSSTSVLLSSPTSILPTILQQHHNNNHHNHTGGCTPTTTHNNNNNNNNNNGKEDTDFKYRKNESFGSSTTAAPFRILFVIVLTLFPFITMYHNATSIINNDVILDEETDTDTDNNTNQQQSQQQFPYEHQVAGLSCEKYGGPYNLDAVNDMIYWQDIPTDNDPIQYESPFYRRGNSNNNENINENDDEDNEQYITFEPDEGGWNNVRMGLETVVGIAVATGRTLVLPPDMKFYLLWNDDQEEEIVQNDDTKKKKNKQLNLLNFDDFFHFTAVANEHRLGYDNNINNHTNHSLFKVITFDEFMNKVAVKGLLVDTVTNAVSYPPFQDIEKWKEEGNHIINYEITNGQSGGSTLWPWLRSVTKPLTWNTDLCVAAFPATKGREGVQNMNQYMHTILQQGNERKGISSYNNHPTPVYDNVTNRLNEILADRNELCIYDETLQKAKVIHAMGEYKTNYRLLIHFYAFLFFENYHMDLWIKRFIRDHFRYVDQVQCTAARIIEQLKKRSCEKQQQQLKEGTTTITDNDKNCIGTYDAMHIRRGDFQYQDMRSMTAEEIYENTMGILQEGQIVFIATDERDKSFFRPLQEHYEIYFLDDFMDLIHNQQQPTTTTTTTTGTNSTNNNPPLKFSKNYYGMLDQLIASRSTIFFGAYYSTFSGYINRLRGYHSTKNKDVHSELGWINSYYYTPEHLRHIRTRMKDTYVSVQQAFWQQEYPVGWRDLDYDVPIQQQQPP